MPFIFTINSADGFRGSLFRDGRALYHSHEVGYDDKVCIVAAILGVSDGEAEQLISLHPEQSIAFFAALKTRALDDALEQLMLMYGNDFAALAAAARNLPSRIRPRDLLAKARQPGVATAGGNFLVKGRR